MSFDVEFVSSSACIFSPCQELSVIEISVQGPAKSPTTANGSSKVATHRPSILPGSSSPLPTLDDCDSGRRVDKRSRFLFPLAFAIFNVVYWIYYLVI